MTSESYGQCLGWKRSFSQRRIQNPVKNQRQSFLRNYLTVSNCWLFSENPSSWMFDRVLNTLLLQSIARKHVIDSDYGVEISEFILFFRRLLARNVKELLIFCSVLDGCRCSVLNFSENRSRLVEQMYSTAENIWFLNFRRLVHVSDADANLSDKCKRHLSKPLGVAERVLFPLPHLYLFLHWYRNIDVINNKEELIYQQICLIFIIDMYLFCFISIEILKHRNFVFGCYLFSAYISEYCKILYHCEKTFIGFDLFNIFLANVSILYPLKTPENQRFSGVSRGYWMVTLSINGLTWNG